MNLVIASLAFVASLNLHAMTFAPIQKQHDDRFAYGSVELPMSKELYPFFAVRMHEFKNVEQIFHDSERKVAGCSFKKVIDIEALKDQSAFSEFLRTGTKPRPGHMQCIFFVLNAYVKLHKILDRTKIFIFNHTQDHVILNPLFLSSPIQAPDLIEYFASIEPSLHACAYLARIPVAQYHL